MPEPSMGNVSRIGVLIILLIGASPLAAEPFGVATVPAAPDSRIAAIWRDLQPAMRADEDTIAVCRANPACGSPAALRFIAIVDDARRCAMAVAPQSVGVVGRLQELCGDEIRGPRCRGHRAGGSTARDGLGQ